MNQFKAIMIQIQLIFIKNLLKCTKNMEKLKNRNNLI